MAATSQFLFAVVLLSLVAHGYSQCSIDSLVITQTLTGRNVGNVPERKVSVSNTCACSQSNIKLICSGFTSTEKVDPSILNQSGSECLFNFGNSVYRDPVTFNYAAANEYPFKVSSSEIACS
ncbi:hypothetical protein ACFE04_017414 [Oxalis oulophora]